MISYFANSQKIRCECDSIYKNQSNNIEQNELYKEKNKEKNKDKNNMKDTISITQEDVFKLLKSLLKNNDLFDNIVSNFTSNQIIYGGKNIDECVNNISYNEFFNINKYIVSYIKNFINNDYYMLRLNNSKQSFNPEMSDNYISYLEINIQIYGLMTEKLVIANNYTNNLCGKKYVFNNCQKIISNKKNLNDKNITINLEYCLELLIFYKKCCERKLNLSDRSMRYIFYYSILSKYTHIPDLNFIHLEHVAEIINSNDIMQTYCNIIDQKTYVSILEKYDTTKEITHFYNMVECIIQNIYDNTYCHCFNKLL